MPVSQERRQEIEAAAPGICLPFKIERTEWLERRVVFHLDPGGKLSVACCDPAAPEWRRQLADSVQINKHAFKAMVADL